MLSVTADMGLPMVSIYILHVANYMKCIMLKSGVIFFGMYIVDGAVLVSRRFWTQAIWSKLGCWKTKMQSNPDIWMTVCTRAKDLHKAPRGVNINKLCEYSDINLAAALTSSTVSSAFTTAMECCSIIIRSCAKAGGIVPHRRCLPFIIQMPWCVMNNNSRRWLCSSRRRYCRNV